MTALIDLVKAFEGKGDGDRTTPRLEPYICPAGWWTLGWGSVFDLAGARVTATTPSIDDDEAEDLLIRDLNIAYRGVARWLPGVKLTDNQTDALADFVYNLGAGALQRSTLRQQLMRGEYDDVPAQLMRFVRGGGRVLPGLVRRRAAEASLWTRP